MHMGSQGRNTPNNSNTFSSISTSSQTEKLVLQSPPTGEKTPVLLCDEESSSASIDDVFFCNLQKKLSSIRKKYSKDDDSSLDSSSRKAIRQDEKNVKQKEVTKTVQDKKYNKTILDGTPVRHNFRWNYIDQVVKKHTVADKGKFKRNLHAQLKTEKKSSVSQFKYNSIDSGSEQIGKIWYAPRSKSVGELCNMVNK